MEFRYSYLRSGLAIFITLIFIALSIYGLIDSTIAEKNKGILIFVLIIFTPILLMSVFTIFVAKTQKRRDKFEKMTLKEKRAYKLKKIK